MYMFGYHACVTSSIPVHKQKDPKAALAISTGAFSSFSIVTLALIIDTRWN
jgi:hypothetical protein